MDSQINLLGYDFLGENGSEGIRYAWRNSKCVPLVESASFVNRRKGKIENISGYTTSVSMGCILKQLGYACRFCRTGAVLPYSGMLSAYDIAKENILMVLMDMEREHGVDSSQNEREFAYMGQGEPGYSYTQLRFAIKLTDCAMKILGQKVYRHIISTSGIPELVYAVADDVKYNYFDSRITMHFSLHATNKRTLIMPINEKYPYQDVLQSLKEFSVLSGEKVCIGILLFNEFSPKNTKFVFTTLIDEIDELLKKVDIDHFRISLCEYNYSVDIGKCNLFSQEKALEILEYIETRGYEVKMFSSFGQKENTACGMLGGQEPQIYVNDRLSELEVYAEELIKRAFSLIREEL